MLQFESGQLHGIIAELLAEKTSAAIYLDVYPYPGSEPRSRVMMMQQGAVTYAGLTLSSPEDLSRAVGQKLRIQVMDSAIQLAAKKVRNTASLQQFFDLFIRLELFSWQDVENYIHNDIILTLEQILSYPGTLKLDEHSPYDFSLAPNSQGFHWDQLIMDVTQRSLSWATLQPIIQSMEAIPRGIAVNQDGISDAWVKDHLNRLVDGTRSLVDIAAQVQRDPLELAHSYLHWLKMGWITFEGTNVAPSQASEQLLDPQAEQPVILSVDDSPIVQAMIKRAIGNRYTVKLANSAMDALAILNAENISLLLLDVTMPDIDGLELCRMIRGISKFRDLPIIMLTAKDGMLNKIKGQIAGSTHYLTKPVDREQLLSVIEKHVVPNCGRNKMKSFTLAHD